MRLSPLRRFDPEHPQTFPFAFEVTEPARWPAGRRWRGRQKLAAPLWAVAWALRSAAWWLGKPFRALAELIEGQPLGYIRHVYGFRRILRRQDGRAHWVFVGPVTPAVIQMFREHPERFEGVTPDLLAQLRDGAK